MGGREKSVRALEAVMESDSPILLAAQKDASVDEPDEDGIYRAGVLANVLQLLKLPDGTVKVLVEGQSREYITEMPGDPAAIQALVRTVGEEFERYAKVKKNIPEEALSAVSETTEPAKLADLVAGHLG